MENRYKLPYEEQKVFFKSVESISNLHATELASMLDVAARTYRDWRRGKYSIPEKIVDILSTQFNITLSNPKSYYIRNWKQSQRKAASIGGIARIKKHGAPGTAEGRKKGGRLALISARKNGTIARPKHFHPPHSYSSSLAEFVGILLGDGHIDRYQWTISLNATKDSQYAQHVISLVKNLFDFNPSVRIRKGYNVMIITGNGIKSIQYFKSIGLRVGNKTKLQVDVPTWIKNNNAYRISCARGLVDTDGGIFKNTYKVNGKLYTYHKLAFVNQSVPLLQFVFETLTGCGFHPTRIEHVSNKRVWLGSVKEVKKYLLIIGTHNPRLLQNLG